jgi:hypothetical protein
MEVQEVKVQPGDSLLIPGDMHHDKQDQKAIELMIKVARAARVNHTCLVGDTFESAGISRHASMKARKNFKLGKGTIKAETKAARPNIVALGELGSKSRNVLTGNHEAWWAMIQDDVPGLADHEWWELYGNLFDGWTVRENSVALKYGPLLVCHGDRLRGSLSKYAAATILANYPGQNTVCGHNHRLDVCTAPTFKYGKQVWHGAWTVGHMKDRMLEIREAIIGPFSEKHQQGFGIATFYSRGRKVSDEKLGFDLQLYRIHRDADDNPMVIYAGAVFK